MLTARGQQADLDAGKTAGADAYLVKPFSPLELLDMVSRYLSDVSIPTQDSK
jgi:DNA-binding response OmpR family regulator